MTELWQVGIVHGPAARLMSPAALREARITWLPDPGSFCFNADPFGLWRDGRLTLLVEALDYRVKRGEIRYYTYDQDWRVESQGLALREPFHLSYPSLIEDGGEIYMLPEGHRSGKLTLYRAERFPDRWQPVATLLEEPAIDASVIRHNGRWWMFYALPGEDNRAMRELHVAFADALTGPWQRHPANPVHVALESARPGGTPFVVDGQLYLPTQNCVGGYGRGLSVLRIDELTSEAVRASVAAALTPEGLLEGYGDGLHTLSQAGDVTLIDVKRLDPSKGRAWVDLQRRFGRILGR